MKQKFYLKLLLLIPSIAILLSSCGSSKGADVYHRDFNIDKFGTDYSRSVYRLKEPVTVLDMMNQNDSFKVYVYNKIELVMQGAFTYNFCAVAFKNNKLFYWGDLDDFKKEQDPLIQMLGEKATDKIMEGKK